MKKQTWRFVLIFLTFVSLVFVGYACDGGSSSGGGGCNGGSSGGYDTESPGAYRTTQNLRSGPRGDSGLFYPNGTGPFPVFLWGCGGSLQPRYYVDHMNHIASWGFIVVSEVSSGNGSELVEALDWIISQNNSPGSVLYQKVDTSKVGAGGHSMGSITTFQMADDPRLSTTIHVAGGSLDGNGGGTRNLRNPTAYINGSADALGATANAAKDYRVTTVPVFWGVLDGVTHMGAPDEGLPAITAWLLWHLKGETQRRADFLNSTGEFQTGKWDSQVKNW